MALFFFVHDCAVLLVKGYSSLSPEGPVAFCGDSQTSVCCKDKKQDVIVTFLACPCIFY